MPIEIKTISEGDQKTFPKPGQTLKIHYEGRLDPSTKDKKTNKLVDPSGKGGLIDSSYVRGQPFVFVLGAGIVLNGIEEALLKMSLKQKCQIVITCDQAYGKTGIKRLVPGEATVVYELELLEIKNDWD